MSLSFQRQYLYTNFSAYKSQIKPSKDSAIVLKGNFRDRIIPEFKPTAFQMKVISLKNIWPSLHLLINLQFYTSINLQSNRTVLCKFSFLDSDLPQSPMTCCSIHWEGFYGPVGLRDLNRQPLPCQLWWWYKYCKKYLHFGYSLEYILWLHFHRLHHSSSWIGLVW